MAKTTYIDCPFCDGMMEIDLKTGKVVNQWGPDDRPKEGEDKMSHVLKKMQADKEKRKDLFSLKKEEMDHHKKKLSDTFKDSVKKAKEDGGDEKPLSPFDLD